MKQIGRATAYVQFSVGGFAYVGVPLYEGKTFEECLRLRSKDITAYYQDGKFVELEKERGKYDNRNE